MESTAPPPHKMPYNDMLSGPGSGDNLCYTSTMVLIGWVLGILLSVSIFFVGELPTCYDTMVLTQVTETHHAFESNITVLETVSEEALRCVTYDVGASICLTLGFLLPFAFVLSIVVWRRRQDGEDICAKDTLGLSVIAAGTAIGMLAGAGLVLVTKMPTANATAAGSAMLIGVVVLIWISLLCSRCYQDYKEEQQEGHVM